MGILEYQITREGAPDSLKRRQGKHRKSTMLEGDEFGIPTIFMLEPEEGSVTVVQGKTKQTYYPDRSNPAPGPFGRIVRRKW